MSIFSLPGYVPGPSLGSAQWTSKSDDTRGVAKSEKMTMMLKKVLMTKEGEILKEGK